LAKLPETSYNIIRDLGFSANTFGFSLWFFIAIKGACRMVKKVLLAVVLIVTTFSLIGCQTTQGLGKDIKWVGEKGAEAVNQE